MEPSASAAKFSPDAQEATPPLRQPRTACPPARRRALSSISRSAQSIGRSRPAPTARKSTAPAPRSPATSRQYRGGIASPSVGTRTSHLRRPHSTNAEARPVDRSLPLAEKAEAGRVRRRAPAMRDERHSHREAIVAVSVSEGSRSALTATLPRSLEGERRTGAPPDDRSSSKGGELGTARGRSVITRCGTPRSRLAGLPTEGPGTRTAGARAGVQEDPASMSSMFLVTTSIVRPSSSVGLNSTTSVPA